MKISRKERLQLIQQLKLERRRCLEEISLWTSEAERANQARWVLLTQRYAGYCRKCRREIIGRRVGMVPCSTEGCQGKVLLAFTHE